jgi:branched-chain amino acid transport system ATP-binding protein
MLLVNHLTASYGAGTVLEGVSLSVAEGMIFGLVGPNGHGKTTLLRAISGLVQRQSGLVEFEGKSIQSLRAEKRASQGIVHVPQGDLIYRNMTILENLLMGGYTNPSTEITRAQLRKVFNLFPKLEERAQQTASSLSGGERRMLGIGRGLMMANVKFLMLDEPSLGLAPVVIDQIYSAIDQLRQDGLTILIVEENVSRISTIADELSLLNHGRIVWNGSAGELAASSDLLQAYLGV